MSEISKADLLWLKTFTDNYQYVLEAYPELFSEDDEDDLKIVKQLIKEKINE